MRIQPAFLIVLDSADSDEIDAVHELVKDSADGWWHRFTNVWIIGGDTADDASTWRDRIQDVIKPGPSSVLVLGLPDQGRTWAYFGPQAKERGEWIHKNYTPD